VNILYVTHLLNGLLMIAMPVGRGIYQTRKFHLGWKLWWIGAGTFILSQVGHLPFNFLLLTPFLQGPITFALPLAAQYPLIALAYGLSAGLFEELSRYAMFRWWAKDARSWRTGLLAGAGHGGIEAIILGLLVLYGFIQIILLQNIGLETVLPADQIALAQEQIAQYWSMPWYASLLGALERAFTIPFHIAASLLVLQTFTRRQGRWLWLAVAWHAIVDAVAVYGVRQWGIYLTEVVIGVGAILSILIIFALRQPEPEPLPVTAEPLPSPVSATELAPVEETPETLDNTRYQS
jgi:uncharacterized membrane protein YhfC